MSKIRERFIKTIDKLPYDIDEEIKVSSVEKILSDVVNKYLELYGSQNLTESDMELIENLIGKI